MQSLAEPSRRHIWNKVKRVTEDFLPLPKTDKDIYDQPEWICLNK